MRAGQPFARIVSPTWLLLLVLAAYVYGIVEELGLLARFSVNDVPIWMLVGCASIVAIAAYVVQSRTERLLFALISVDFVLQVAARANSSSLGGFGTIKALELLTWAAILLTALALLLTRNRRR